MDSRSGHRLVLVAVFLFLGFFALSADAQGCDPVSSWIVSLGCNGSTHTGNTICMRDTAVCEVTCNANPDCGDPGQACMEGVCANALVACNNNSDCAPGFGCNGSTGECAPCGTSGVACPGNPCDGMHCDDGLACNGIETCEGGRCIPGTRLNCNDQDATTNDRCVENGVRNGVASARCDNYKPSKCSKRPGTGELRLTATRSRGVGLTWSGKIDGDFSSAPAGMRVLLTDGSGAPFLDATAGTDNGSWLRSASGWSWTPRLKGAAVRKVTLHRNGTYRLDADFSSGTLDLGRIVQPDAAALVDFVAPDTVDICSGFPKLECIPGSYGMQCRTRTGGRLNH